MKQLGAVDQLEEDLLEEVLRRWALAHLMHEKREQALSIACEEQLECRGLPALVLGHQLLIGCPVQGLRRQLTWRDWGASGQESKYPKACRPRPNWKSRLASGLWRVDWINFMESIIQSKVFCTSRLCSTLLFRNELVR